MNDKDNSVAELDKKIKERLSMGTPKEKAIFWSIFMALIAAAYFGSELIKSIAIILIIILLISRSIYYTNKKEKQKPEKNNISPGSS